MPISLTILFTSIISIAFIIKKLNDKTLKKRSELLDKPISAEDDLTRRYHSRYLGCGYQSSSTNSDTENLTSFIAYSSIV